MKAQRLLGPTLAYTGLEVVPDMDKPLMLYFDNSGAVKNFKEPRCHKRGKHIERKYHLIREIVYRKDVNVVKIASEDILVDPFTKTLPESVFNKHLSEIGLSKVVICEFCLFYYIIK